MALVRKLIHRVYIKSDGDLFHDIFKSMLHQLSTISPGNIKGSHLHEGEWGTVGSVFFLKYIHGGKERVAKEIVEAIDEEKKSVSFKIIDGDLLQLYKSFAITVHVDTTGDNNLVTWTFNYEKLNENVEDPTSLMDVCIEVTKHIETHHLK